MNSKILFLLSLFILSSCGVKAPPLKHPETIVDSYTAEYTGGTPTAEELERIKSGNVIPSGIDPKKNAGEPTPTPKP